MGTIKRRGARLLLLVLPDGSRSLIPASWTDWSATEVADQPSPTIRQQRREPCLAPLTDLLHLRVIVDALLGRCPIPQAEPASDEERHHAMDPGISRAAHVRSKNNKPGNRRQRTRRGA